MTATLLRKTCTGRSTTESKAIGDTLNLLLKAQRLLCFVLVTVGVYQVWGITTNWGVKAAWILTVGRCGYYREWCNLLASCRQKRDFLNLKWWFQHCNHTRAAYCLVHQHHCCHMNWQNAPLTPAAVWILDRQLPRKHQSICSHVILLSVSEIIWYKCNTKFRNRNRWLRQGSGELCSQRALGNVCWSDEKGSRLNSSQRAETMEFNRTAAPQVQN